MAQSLKPNPDNVIRVGDLVLCVKGGNISNHPYQGPYPIAGRIGKVLSITPNVEYFDGKVYTSLEVEGQPPNMSAPYWPAFRFVKIPPHSEDAEDRETIRLLKGKPLLLPAPSNKEEWSDTY